MPKTLFGRVLFMLYYGTGSVMVLLTGLTILGDFLEKRETKTKKEDLNEDSCEDNV